MLRGKPHSLRLPSGERRIYRLKKKKKSAGGRRTTLPSGAVGASQQRSWRITAAAVGTSQRRIWRITAAHLAHHSGTVGPTIM